MVHAYILMTLSAIAAAAKFLEWRRTGNDSFFWDGVGMFIFSMAYLNIGFAELTADQSRIITRRLFLIMAGVWAKEAFGTFIALWRARKKNEQ